MINDLVRLTEKNFKSSLLKAWVNSYRVEETVLQMLFGCEH